jgi:hypothetical protein
MANTSNTPASKAASQAAKAAKAAAAKAAKAAAKAAKATQAQPATVTPVPVPTASTGTVATPPVASNAPAAPVVPTNPVTPVPLPPVPVGQPPLANGPIGAAGLPVGTYLPTAAQLAVVNAAITGAPCVAGLPITVTATSIWQAGQGTPKALAQAAQLAQGTAPWAPTGTKNARGVGAGTRALPVRQYATPADYGLTPRRLALFALLHGAGATSAATAMPRAQVAAAGYGAAILDATVYQGQCAKVALPGGGVGLYLTGGAGSLAQAAQLAQGAAQGAGAAATAALAAAQAAQGAVAPPANG